MLFVFSDGVLKMAKNTGFVVTHGIQTGVTMVSSRSREATMNVASNLKWLAVFQWTAKIFTSKIFRTDPYILLWIGYSKIRNYNNVLYVFCTCNKQYTCRKFWIFVFLVSFSIIYSPFISFTYATEENVNCNYAHNHDQIQKTLTWIQDQQLCSL